MRVKRWIVKVAPTVRAGHGHRAGPGAAAGAGPAAEGVARGGGGGQRDDRALVVVLRAVAAAGAAVDAGGGDGAAGGRGHGEGEARGVEEGADRSRDRHRHGAGAGAAAGPGPAAEGVAGVRSGGEGDDGADRVGLRAVAAAGAAVDAAPRDRPVRGRGDGEGRRARRLGEDLLEQRLRRLVAGLRLDALGREEPGPGSPGRGPLEQVVHPVDVELGVGGARADGRAGHDHEDGRGVDDVPPGSHAPRGEPAAAVERDRGAERGGKAGAGGRGQGGDHLAVLHDLDRPGVALLRDPLGGHAHGPGAPQVDLVARGRRPADDEVHELAVAVARHDRASGGDAVDPLPVGERLARHLGTR